MLLATILLLATFSILALAALYSKKFGTCVQLPSGANLSYEAYADFSRPYFFPMAVLRQSDGTIIGRDIFPIRTTETATYGTVWPDHNGPALFTFIWHKDHGLVRRDRTPKLFEQLQSDLGEKTLGAPRDLNVNTLWLMTRLQNFAHFQGTDCKVRLITW
ncbi:hypothetical protein [Ruegeria profundi]|uniref:hypothetical protein n=1 Tax=Ruegeria profundi TaxID=1685378 RepID=UPI0012FDE11F|nr:hypothetical protein [Ruegeria profundi]